MKVTHDKPTLLTYIFRNIITAFWMKVHLSKLIAEFLSGKIAAMGRLYLHFFKKKRLDLAPFAKSLEDLFYNDISTSVTTACSLHHQTKLGRFGSYLLPKSKMFSTHFIRKQKLDAYDLSYLRGSKVTTNGSLFL